MKASDRVLAGRYAKAIFMACAGQEEQTLADLIAAQKVLQSDKGASLRHPQVAPALKKENLRQAVGGKPGSWAIRSLDLLIDKKRIDLLPLIAVEMAGLIAAKNKTITAHVRAAFPLSVDEQAKLRQRLELFCSKTVDLEIKQDPEIIAGLVVRLGDWVLDSSLKGQLRTMREALYVH